MENTWQGQYAIDWFDPYSSRLFAILLRLLLIIALLCLIPRGLDLVGWNYFALGVYRTMPPSFDIMRESWSMDIRGLPTHVLALKSKNTKKVLRR